VSKLITKDGDKMNKNIKKTISILLVMILAIVSLAACGSSKTGSGGTEKSGEIEVVGMPNPWTDCKDKKEAEELAGYTINTAPEQVEGCKECIYRFLDGTPKILEVIYADENGNEILRVRKTVGADPKDIDGDYNNYTYGVNACGDTRSYQLFGKGENNVKKAFVWAKENNETDVSYVIYISDDVTYTDKMTAEFINALVGDADKAQLEPLPGKEPVSEKEPAPVKEPVSEKEPEVSEPIVIGDPKKPGDDAAYSHTNLIISVDKKFSAGELDEFLKKYDVDLLYDYDSFNMYAVSTKEEKSIDELTKLASRMIDENPNITAAELDGIVTIYSTDENVTDIITGTEKTMTLAIGDKKVPVTWEENDSVKALMELANNGLSIRMSMYGGFEQVGSIGQDITKNDIQMTTSSGDIVLYSGNQIVIFYGSNSWSYTKLGHVDLSKEEMTELLSKGDVTITLKTE
jgi:hypothetical protein